MKRMPAVLLFVLLSASLSQTQSPAGPQTSGAPGRGPTKTIKIGKASFNYYQKPEAVAAAATFYLSGSQRTSSVFDFVAVTVAFVNAGTHLTEPSFVLFDVYAATFRDGCKYRDRYADKDLNRLRLGIFADERPVFSTDLSLPPGNIINSRNGKVCTELYAFQMPYEKFRILVDARKAEMRLGMRQFKLKGDHLDALRTMKDGIGEY